MAQQRLSAADRRSSILDAAAVVFGRRGFEATRMEDVADAAGVAKGLLYKHFGSKDDLFEALVTDRVRGFSDELAHALSGTPADAEAMLETGFSLWLSTLSSGRVPLSDPGVHDAYVMARDRVRDLLSGLVALLHPGLHRDEAWLLAAAIQGAAESVGEAWMRTKTVSPDAASALLARFCWNGLQGLGGPRPATSPPRAPRVR